VYYSDDGDVVKTLNEHCKLECGGSVVNHKLHTRELLAYMTIKA